MDAPAATHATPSSSAALLELRCPRCGYNLRGLPQPRCPECGLDFDWAELSAVAEQQRATRHFEHRWRNRPLRSLVYTASQALRPWRLWRETSLVLPPRVGPLLALVLLLAGARSLLVLSAAGLELMLMVWVYDEPVPMGWPIVGLIAQALVTNLATFAETAALGLLGFLFLQIFQQTMARARVRPAHTLRVIVLVWLGPLVLVLVVGSAQFLLTVGTHALLGWTVNWLILGAVGELTAVLLAAYSLCLALDVYLRLKHGRLVALSALATLGLLVITAVIAATAWIHEIFPNPAIDLLGTLFPATRELFVELATR